MKIYKIEFRYFDGASWSRVTKEIYASTIFQLIRTFLNETSCLYEEIYCKELKKFRYKTNKDLWKEIKIEEIKFPLVIEK